MKKKIDQELLDTKLKLLDTKIELLKRVSDDLDKEIEEFRELYFKIDEKVHLLSSILDRMDKGVI